MLILLTHNDLILDITYQSTPLLSDMTSMYSKPRRLDNGYNLPIDAIVVWHDLDVGLSDALSIHICRHIVLK
jgi:hypothetical protein